MELSAETLLDDQSADTTLVLTAVCSDSEFR